MGKKKKGRVRGETAGENGASQVLGTKVCELQIQTGKEEVGRDRAEKATISLLSSFGVFLSRLSLE